METKNVVILLSGHRKKNTWEMANAFREGCEEKGHSVDFFHIKDYALKQCTGCESCSKTGKCIIKDEMDIIYRALDKADIIVLASPLYFYTFTSDMKLVIDRAQPYWSNKYIRKVDSTGKKPVGIFLSNHGGIYEHNAFFATYLPVKTFFSSFNAKYKANYFISRTDKLPVKEREDVKEELRQWGRNLDKLPATEVHR